MLRFIFVVDENLHYLKYWQEYPNAERYSIAGDVQNQIYMGDPWIGIIVEVAK